MRERPILFSGPMIRALLDDRKTQTRRIIAPQPVEWRPGDLSWPGPFNTEKPYKWKVAGEIPYVLQQLAENYCPYGARGDRLWVRETWCQATDPITAKPLDGKAYYRADGTEVFRSDGDGGTAWRKDGFAASPWRPSIFMPRWASRITLQISDVRVEKLQEITDADIIAEGFELDAADKYPGMPRAARRRVGVEHGWDSINSKRADWSSNPWVWVVTFKRVESREVAA